MSYYQAINQRAYDKQNTHQYMVARYVSFISTDVDRKHDGYAVVIDISL